jgi:short-subunit dehydrogenase
MRSARVFDSVRVLDLAGQTALLTGASGGIGRAIAAALHSRGARVLLNGRRVDALEQLRAELGDRVEVLAADLSDRTTAAGLAERAGAVDVLVANAALPASGALTDFTPEQLDRALDVNLRAPIQLARALVPGMVERRRGHLVFISSLSGKVASKRSTVYSATKFGLRGFASGLREDLHRSGVGVTVVFPGFVSGAGMFARTGVELPRYVGTCTPEEVADAVVKGVEQGKAELDVAPLGLRAGVLLSSLAPVTAARVQRRLGSERLASDIAEGQSDKR